MTKDIAIYVRVSGKRQDTRSQLSDLKRWSEAFAGSRPVKWYEDKATGKNMDRPGWQRLEADMHAGKISKIVVWRLDRLGRTAAGLTSHLKSFSGWAWGLSPCETRSTWGPHQGVSWRIFSLR